MEDEENILRFYGSSTVGERGQLVLPKQMREEFHIGSGDKLLILGGKQMGVWGIIMVKSQVLSKLIGQIGGNLLKILAESED